MDRPGQKVESIVIPALDGLDVDKAEKILKAVKSKIYAFKIHDLWDNRGPGIVAYLKTISEAKAWVDLKLNDIPQTVKNRALAVKNAGGDIITVMANGEIEMMMAAVETGLEVYAVTVLTSLSEEQAQLIYGQPAKAAVLHLARLAKLAGVHGIVCSPQEVAVLASRPELKGLKFITPGVRSPGADEQDQKRVGTHLATFRGGANHLVVGREITTAADPAVALENIFFQLMAT